MAATLTTEQRTHAVQLMRDGKTLTDIQRATGIARQTLRNIAVQNSITYTQSSPYGRGAKSRTVMSADQTIEQYWRGMKAAARW